MRQDKINHLVNGTRVPKRLLLASAASLTLAVPAHASSDSFDSVLHAVSDVKAIGFAWLAKGKYRTANGSTKLTIEIPTDMRSSLSFDMRRRTIQSAEWAFDKPIILTVEAGGKCVRLSVKKLKYGLGGLPIPGQSDTTMTPGPGGSCNDSEAMLGLDDVFAVNEDSSTLFRGALFSSSATVKRCTTHDCSTLAAASPITRVKFVGGLNGNAEIPAFAVGFREGSTIVLPGQSFVKLGAQSGASFDRLDYDLRTQEGKADLSKLTIPVETGVIASGDTLLKLTSLSNLTAEAMSVSTTDTSFLLDKGSISGRLGEGTNIMFGAPQGKVSSVKFLGADTLLTGVTLARDATGISLKILRGNFNSKLQSADLWMTSNTNLRLGYTNLGFTIGCPSTESAGCVGASWSPGNILVRGKIDTFATNITGGQFPLSEAGMTEIKSGAINAGVLTVDSSDLVSPITGPISEFDVAFEGRDLFIDGQTKVRAARVELSSRDLTLVKGETLPSGTLDLKGDIDRFEAAGVGRVAAIDGTLKLRVSRKAGDEPRVVDGEIMAKTRVRLEGANYADGKLEMRDMRYYRGHGEAKAQLTIDKAQYVLRTPGETKRDDNAIARIEINVRPVDLTVSLRNPILFGPFEVEAFHSQWAIDPFSSPFQLNIGIPSHELVYAPIKDKLAGSTLCAPKVNLAEQLRVVSGTIHVDASSTGGKVAVRDMSSDGPVDADVDDRGCSEVAALICGVVGSFGGPLGSAALAAICNGKVEEAEADMEQKIRTMSTDEVTKFRYDFGW